MTGGSGVKGNIACSGFGGKSGAPYPRFLLNEASSAGSERS
jgi:hypothetical protein